MKKLRTLTAADATRITPPRNPRKVVKTNPPPKRVIKGRGWVA